MALTVTLAELRTAVRWRSDTTGATNPSDAELNWYINKAIRKIYGHIAQHRAGQEHYGITQTFSTVAGTSTYSFATIFSPSTEDVLHIFGVDLQISGNWRRLATYNFQERNRYADQSVWSDLVRPAYAVVGRSIRFHPAPDAAESVRLWYVPILADLSADADTFDGVNGWEEFVELDAAVQVKSKRDQDVSTLLHLRQEAFKQVVEQADQLQAGDPYQMHDIRATEDDLWL